MDTWVASIFWLLWTMLLWMLVYKYLFACLLRILLGIHPGGQFLNHMVILCAFFFWRTDILFSTAATPFYIPTSKAQGFKFLHILTSMFSVCVCAFLSNSHANEYEVSSMGMNHLPVVLIYISLMVSGFKHLLICLLPFVYLLWRNVFSSHFLIGLFFVVVLGDEISFFFAVM